MTAIGGHDITLHGQTSPEDREVIIESFKSVWPDLVVDDDEEFFVYRNKKALTSWCNNGRTDGNADQMIHVLIGPEMITFVIEIRSAEHLRMVSDAQSDLRSRRKEKP